MVKALRALAGRPASSQAFPAWYCASESPGLAASARSMWARVPPPEALPPEVCLAR